MLFYKVSPFAGARVCVLMISRLCLCIFVCPCAFGFCLHREMSVKGEEFYWGVRRYQLSKLAPFPTARSFLPADALQLLNISRSSAANLEFEATRATN